MARLILLKRANDEVVGFSPRQVTGLIYVPAKPQDGAEAQLTLTILDGGKPTRLTLVGNEAKRVYNKIKALEAGDEET